MRHGNIRCDVTGGATGHAFSAIPVPVAPGLIFARRKQGDTSKGESGVGSACCGFKIYIEIVNRIKLRNGTVAASSRIESVATTVRIACGKRTQINLKIAAIQAPT